MTIIPRIAADLQAQRTAGGFGPHWVLCLIDGESPAVQKRIILNARRPGCELITDEQAEILIRTLELAAA